MAIFIQGYKWVLEVIKRAGSGEKHSAYSQPGGGKLGELEYKRLLREEEKKATVVKTCPFFIKQGHLMRLI